MLRLALLLAAAAHPAFEVGETLRYEVRWLGITSGEMTLSVAEETGQPGQLRIEGQGRTLGAAESLFRVRSDSYCVVDREGLAPVLCRSTFTSRSRERRREVRYDRAAGQIRETLLDEGEVERHTRALVADSQEVLSALYLARTRPLEPGHPFSFRGARGDKPVRVTCVPEGEESIDGVRAMRLTLHVDEKAEADQADSGQMWVSADTRHVPLRLRFVAPVGTLEIALVEARNLTDGPSLDQVPMAPRSLP